jgi:hypothetical protein
VLKFQCAPGADDAGVVAGRGPRRLLKAPGFKEVFFKPDGAGGWRVPAVNESCCVRAALADLLDAVGAQVGFLGLEKPLHSPLPDIILTSKLVSCGACTLPL